jgi:tetratricopeptide (TPR) repeat protein
MCPAFPYRPLVAAAALLLAGACSRAPGEWEFERGQRELQRGRAVQARALFEQSIARRPGHAANAIAYNLLGVACWKLGQPEAARAAFEDSLRLEPQQPQASYNLGVWMAENGDFDRAARLLAAAAAADRTDLRALAYLGQIQIRRQQWPEARRALYAGLAQHPQSADLHAALAQVAWGTGDTNAALESLMTALELNARHAPALYNLGVVHQEMNHPQEAVAYFTRYLALVPPDEPHAALARQALKRTEAVAPAPVTVAAAPTNRPPPAAPAPATAAGPEDILRRAVLIADKGNAALALELCLQVADQAGRAGRIDLQEKALRTASKSCFDQPRAHEALGRFLLAQKRATEAIKAFKQATVLDSNFVPAQLGMAQAAIHIGEFDAALVGLKEAVRADAKNSEALWALASLYDQQLDLPEHAARTYADFAARFPQHARVAAAKARARELAPAIQFPPYPAPPAESVTLTVTARAPAEVSAPVPPAPVAATNRAAAPAPPSPPPAAPAVAGTPDSAAVAPVSRIRYRKPARRNTRDAVQALNRGRLYLEQNNLDQAVYYFIRSVENDDTMAAAFYYLATAYSEKGELDLAKDGYLRTLQLDAQFVNARYHLALIYQQQKDDASALRLLQEVVRDKPDYAAAHYVLAYLFAKSPATAAQARPHYERFLQLAPNDPAAPAVRKWLQGR